MPRSRADLNQSPLRFARKNLGLTIADFAAQCQVHEQALYLNECGCYASVLPKVEATLKALGTDVNLLSVEYHRFQLYKRQEFASQLGVAAWDLSDLGASDLDRSPIASLRERLTLSQLAFSKNLCVQPAIIYKCEKGRAAGLPEQLIHAFKDAQLSSHLVDELDDRQAEFYHYCLARTG